MFNSWLESEQVKRQDDVCFQKEKEVLRAEMQKEKLRLKDFQVEIKKAKIVETEYRKIADERKIVTDKQVYIDAKQKSMDEEFVEQKKKLKERKAEIEQIYRDLKASLSNYCGKHYPKKNKSRIPFQT